MLARCARGSKGDVKRIKAKELKREDHEYLLHLIYIYIYIYIYVCMYKEKAHFVEFEVDNEIASIYRQCGTKDF